MAETAGPLRRDPISGAWSVVAPGRRRRPHDASAGGAPARGSSAGDVRGGEKSPGSETAAGTPAGGASTGSAQPACAFCEGNEALTPPEVDALRAPGSPADGPGWTVRAVPNKYPILPGAHEVIIHSPDHELDIDRLDDAQAATVIEMYGRRLAAQLENSYRAVTITYNRGACAGASLAHPHSQVFATSIVPPRLLEELENFARFRNRYGGCLLCEELERARADGRTVLDGEMVAWVPAAPMAAYHVWLAPAAHAADLRETVPARVGRAFRRTLAALTATTGDAPLNAWLHTAPAELTGPFHWHFELLPRLGVLAGFELGTGITVCETDPMESAAEIRAALHD